MTTTELLLDAPDPHHPTTDRYRLSLAADSGDVQAARRLRDEVFSAEFGAITPGPDGVDADDFDDLCDHLIVWHRSDRNDPGHDADRLDAGGAIGSRRGQAVATYRLLPPHSNDSTPLASGLYAAGEFDVTPLEGLLDSCVEAGRSCVHADHRGGTAVSLLWGGIARYMHLSGYRYLVGCASVALDDGGGNAAAFGDLAMARHAAPEKYHCRPYRPFDPTGIERPARATIPPLLKGYLRLGAVVCGPAALDPEFGTADFLVLLDLERADQRYLRFFLGSAAGR
ncbi:GNAT family N-acetyltransferase [Nakamurella lactea]|uniref:GNAT family N-acetyltransferase n=1 Tax=Nakamurella lactea TaxID=459515 RepID=UPI0004082467|nr:GNAT family N-acyltransferase [Nakamurella lactea]